MAHGKETPRQKMIGMMYLVLTALLALNVSREILEAFVIVDKGLNKTTKNFTDKNKSVYADFEKSAILNEAKTKKWKAYAFEVKKHADQLTALIQDLKIQIVNRAEGAKNNAVKGDEIDGVEIKSKDNTAEPMQIMLGNNNDGAAIKLKAGIKDFKQYIYSIEGVDKAEALKASIEKELDIEPPPTKLKEKKLSWEEAHFEELPLIAVITIMSSLQANIRNAESDLLTYLYAQIDKNDIKFNELNSVVIPKTDYVIRGDEFEAQLFIGAFDTTKNPRILIGNVEEKRLPDGTMDYAMKGSYDSVRTFKDGRGIWKASSGIAGQRNFDGLIILKAPGGGSDIKKPFHTKYSVNAPQVTVSPTKMNVFYRGVDNPVDVAASGFSADKISISLSNGMAKKMSGSSYIINPTKLGNAQVSVLVDIDGKKKAMGTLEFRVRDLPSPVANVGGKKYGTVEKGWLGVQDRVTAVLEGSEFDYKYTILSFEVTTMRSGGVEVGDISTSDRITPAQLNIIKGASSGSKIRFEQIKVLGPEGGPRDPLPGITFKVK
jgi:gliding motility-associated protein GldM